MTQQEWQARAGKVLPGGGFGNYDASVFIARGQGSRVWDEDGNEYLDYLIGSGPMLLGHGHPEVNETISEQLASGATFFANNSAGVMLAEEIVSAVPAAEQVRFVSTGGEADMYAIRLARAFTGRDRIIKFEGGYHGMSAEAQMSLAPKTDRPFPEPVPDSAGIPAAVAADVLIAPFNDADYVASLMSDEVAAIIVEPLQRQIPPEPGFLEALRDLCDKHGALLVFDEIVTGFRFAYGGAQAVYGVTPDICTLGKVIGGGLPLAAIAGRSDVMAHFDAGKVAPGKSLMQVGTLSGNPLAAAAGLKTLEILKRPGTYEKLIATGEKVMALVDRHLGQSGVEYQIVGHPTLFDVVFTDKPVRNYRDIQDANASHMATYNQAMREGGILKSPAKLYPSLALTDADLELTSKALADAAGRLSASA